MKAEHKQRLAHRAASSVKLFMYRYARELSDIYTGGGPMRAGGLGRRPRDRPPLPRVSTGRTL